MFKVLNRGVKSVSALFIGVTTVISSVMSFNVQAAIDPLADYQAVLDDFNSQYGTEYQFACDTVLESDGSNYDEMVSFFKSMNKDEFKQYVYEAYVNSDFEKESEENEENEETSKKVQDPLRVVTSTQKLYYLGADTLSEYLYATATWISVSGENRYVTYITAGETHTDGHSHYALLDTPTHSFSNYSQQLDMNYHCTRIDKYGLQYGNYYIPVTFYAGYGDIVVVV